MTKRQLRHSLRDNAAQNI